MSSSDPPAQSSGVDDTVPATDPDDLRARRATVPDIPREERYRLGAEIGRGGMGRVVEAFDMQLGRTVALKEVLPRGGAGVEARFEREVQITARLEHPAIVPLYDSGRTPDGRPFYVMRRVSGRPLDQLLARGKTLPERLALLPNLLAAFDAIAHAHRRHIVHRDLKPSNILVGDNGETVVIDWGLAKVVGETEPEAPDGAPRAGGPASSSIETQAGTVFGTPGFMPPEQARGETSTERGDVFALGATLYHLLAGRPPIAGSGPTEVIASTIQRRIAPIADAAPTAAPELHAIVEKALAFEPGDRYASAEELAEDLRRFSTGQLVAAHRYTARERLARFARRNRAPLSVAALALAAGAVLAWVGVHRIMVERDLATTARDDATRERAEAVALAHEERDHADAQLVAEARAELELDPTVALATLSELGSDSPRLPAARGVAASAVARGVARAYASVGRPMSLDLDRTAHRLAETTQDTARVWDLDAHRLLYEHAFRGRARWLADGRLLLFGIGTPAVALDVAAGRTDALGVGAIEILETDAARAHLAVIDPAGAAKLFDLASGKVTPLWPGHVARHVLISPDGTAVALADAATTAVIDAATGRVAFSRPGEVVLDDAADGRFAGIDPQMKPFEIVRGATGWSAVAYDVPGAVDASYPDGGGLDAIVTRGDNLLVHLRDGKVVGRHAMTITSTGIAHVARGVTVVPTDGSRLAYYSSSVSGTLVLPLSLAYVRLAGRRDQTRLAAAGDGLVFVYDLAEVLPQFVAKDGVFDVAFGSPDALLLWPGRDFAGFGWWSLTAHTLAPIDADLDPMTVLLDVDPADGRLLLAAPLAVELAIARVGQPTLEPLMTGGKSLFGQLAPGGAVIADGATSRVLFAGSGAPPRELAKVDGGVSYVQVLDRRHFAALGNAGELVRGALAGGALEHIRVAPDRAMVLSHTLEGDVVIATGPRLQVWPTGGALRPLATLPHAIERALPVKGGLLAELEDRSVWLVEPSGAMHEVLPTSTCADWIGDGGAWVASAGVNGQVDVVEVPSLVRWSLPQQFTTQCDMPVATSPSGRRLALPAAGGYEIYNLVDPGSDLAAWIADHTNAVTSPDGALHWR